MQDASELTSAQKKALFPGTPEETVDVLFARHNELVEKIKAAESTTENVYVSVLDVQEGEEETGTVFH